MKLSHYKLRRELVRPIDAHIETFCIAAQLLCDKKNSIVFFVYNSAILEADEEEILDKWEKGVMEIIKTQVC